MMHAAHLGMTRCLLQQVLQGLKGSLMQLKLLLSKRLPKESFDCPAGTSAVLVSACTATANWPVIAAPRIQI